MGDPSILERPLGETVPLSPEALAVPHEYSRRLRDAARVYRCPNTQIFFVSHYDTAKAVLRDHETFSNRFGLAMGGANPDPRLAEVQKQGWPPVDTMLTQDLPEHRRYRGLVNQAFTARRVAKLAPRMEAICRELIDGFADAGRCDFVADFAVPLPVVVIAEQLGVPAEDLPRIKRWSDGFVAQLSMQASPDEQVEAAKLILEYQHYFAKKLDERKADRRDDIISDLVHARIEGERPLDTAESLSILQQLMVAGNQTTTHSIAEGMLLLIQNPDPLALLQADPELVDNAVEEILRLSTPTANMWRVAKRDVEVEGVQIPKGSMVQVRFSSANRDEAEFEEPERFDVRRENARSQIAFGFGLHSCVGAALARKEMSVAFRVLLERLHRFELAVDASELRYAPNVLLRGLDALPIRFEARR